MEAHSPRPYLEPNRIYAVTLNAGAYMSADTGPGVATDAWLRSSKYFFEGVLAANRAAFAAFGLPVSTTRLERTRERRESGSEAEAEDGPRSESESGAGTGTGFGPDFEDGNGEKSLVGVTLPEWDITLSATRRDAIDVGDSVRFEKTLSDADVRTFALSSGDTNRLHLGDEFAAGTRFGGRIAHGTLASGLISAALAHLPGLVIYLSQDLEFRAPVGIGDRVAADCEVVEDLGDYRYRLSTAVTDADTGDVVIDGEAVILLDEEPKNAE